MKKVKVGKIGKPVTRQEYRPNLIGNNSNSTTITEQSNPARYTTVISLYFLLTRFLFLIIPLLSEIVLFYLQLCVEFNLCSQYSISTLKAPIIR